MEIIKVLDFSEYPGLRHCSVSDDSGEEFYHKLLNINFKNALEKQELLTVDLDGTAGYAPSFIDEAFGNLVFDFTLKKVKENLRIKSDEEPDWLEVMNEQTFLQWEERRINGENPKKTKKHQDWYVWSGTELVVKNQ